MLEKALGYHIDKPLYFYRIHKGGISTFDNGKYAFFWQWVAMIHKAERTGDGDNLEKLFYNYFVNKEDYDPIKKKLELIKKSRLLKLLYRLGLFKNYKYL